MRQQYIDILKGFTIIWVLWMHMDMPELIYPSVQMPIFFFISGAFYHAKFQTLWQQIKEDSYKLLLPALVFSFLAFAVLWGEYLNLSPTETIKGCLSASIVWFLIALFYFRTTAYVCVRLNKNIGILIVALLIYVPGFYLYAKGNYWILPFFPLSHMGVFMIWFAIGMLYGKKIFVLVSQPSRITGVCVIATTVYVLLVHYLDWDSGVLGRIPWLMYGFPYTFGVIFVMLLLTNQMDKIKITKPLNKALTYVGESSIVFYLTHWPLWMYVFKPLRWNLYLSFLCIVLLEFPLIYIFNHYLPWCIGKKYKKNEK